MPFRRGRKGNCPVGLDMAIPTESQSARRRRPAENQVVSASSGNERAQVMGDYVDFVHHTLVITRPTTPRTVAPSPSRLMAPVSRKNQEAKPTPDKTALREYRTTTGDFRFFRSPSARAHTAVAIPAIALPTTAARHSSARAEIASAAREAALSTDQSNSRLIVSSFC